MCGLWLRVNKQKNIIKHNTTSPAQANLVRNMSENVTWEHVPDSPIRARAWDRVLNILGSNTVYLKVVQKNLSNPTSLIAPEGPEQ